jgi:hypothetical protein
LEEEPGLPDGQSVSITIVAAKPPTDNLRRLFGCWAEDAAELDEFLEQVRRDRKQTRGEIEP